MDEIQERYEAWERRLDARCQAGLGVSLSDIPDMDTYTWFACGISPAVALVHVVRELKGMGFAEGLILDMIEGGE